MGRPTKLTPQRQEAILRLLRSGITIETACGAAGIGSSTYRVWMAKGAEGREPYATFMAAATRARDEQESYLAGIIARAAVPDEDGHPGDWRAAAWLLERSRPTKWGRQTRTELTGADGGPLEVRTAPAQPLDAESVEQMVEVMRRSGLIDADEFAPSPPSGNGSY